MTKTATGVKCKKCKCKARDLNDWDVAAERGYVVGFVCPRCQVPIEKPEPLTKPRPKAVVRRRKSAAVAA